MFRHFTVGVVGAGGIGKSAVIDSMLGLPATIPGPALYTCSGKPEVPEVPKDIKTVSISGSIADWLELPGYNSIPHYQTLYKQYLSKCHTVLFVIDANSPLDSANECEALRFVLKCAEASGIRVRLVVNKFKYSKKIRASIDEKLAQNMDRMGISIYAHDYNAYYYLYNSLSPIADCVAHYREWNKIVEEYRRSTDFNNFIKSNKKGNTLLRYISNAKGTYDKSDAQYKAIEQLLPKWNRSITYEEAAELYPKIIQEVRSALNRDHTTANRLAAMFSAQVGDAHPMIKTNYVVGLVDDGILHLALDKSTAFLGTTQGYEMIPYWDIFYKLCCLDRNLADKFYRYLTLPQLAVIWKMWSFSSDAFIEHIEKTELKYNFYAFPDTGSQRIIEQNWQSGFISLLYGNLSDYLIQKSDLKKLAQTQAEEDLISHLPGCSQTLLKTVSSCYSLVKELTKSPTLESSIMCYIMCPNRAKMYQSNSDINSYSRSAKALYKAHIQQYSDRIDPEVIKHFHKAPSFESVFPFKLGFNPPAKTTQWQNWVVNPTPKFIHYYNLFSLAHNKFKS